MRSPIQGRRDTEDLEVLAGRRGRPTERAARIKDLDAVLEKLAELEKKIKGIEVKANKTVISGGGGGSITIRGKDVKSLLAAELAWLDGELLQLDQDLIELNEVTLPQLESDLDTLNTVTLPQLETDLHDLDVDLAALTTQLGDIENIPKIFEQTTIEGFTTVVGNFFLPGGQIIANSITTLQIAAGAVTATEIAAGAVTASEIGAGAVTAVKISAGAITADKLAADAVIANKIAAGAVTADKIAANAVTANKIGAGEVIAGKIGANAVTANNIVAGTITANEIIADGVTRFGVAGSAAVNNNSSSFTTVCSFTMNTPVISNIQGNVTFQLSQDASLYPSDVLFQVLVQGVTVISLIKFSILSYGGHLITRPFTLQNAFAGTPVVQLRMRNCGGAGVDSSNLSAVAFLR